MTVLSQLSLREPLWLVLTVLPFIALAWRKSSYSLPPRLKEFADPHLWGWLITQPDRIKPSLPWLLIIAWLAAVVAMSGPYLKRQQGETRQQRSMDIAVIIDISPSMKTRDVFPSRLERAKLEMRDFVGNLKGDRTALIAFSANAYEILPLTHDRETLLHFVDALDVTLTRKRGSNITQALELAHQALAKSKNGSRAIVLISDGETNDQTSAMGAAQRLKKDGIPLYILGVGTEAGGPVEDDLGRLLHHNDELVVSQLQRPTLTSLATISGGAYTDLKNDNGDWQRLFTAMERLERNNIYQAPSTQQGYQLYPWLLGLSIILFVWAGTRRFDAVAMVLIAPFTFGHEAQASSWQEHQAYDAFVEGNYGKASIAYEQVKTFNGQMGMGAAAYRLGDWQLALDAFLRAGRLAETDKDRARAAYNRGNTLARMGDFEKASAAFEEALALQKHYPHAALNLSLINKARMQSGLKNDQPEIVPDARDTLSDENAEHISSSAATNQKQTGASSESSSTNRVDHKKVIDQAIARWNLGNAGTDDALGSALWQLRSLDESSAALLRVRFAEQDAQYPNLPEEQPW